MNDIMRLLETELRFDTWGPGYLARADDAAFGTLVLRPGDSFTNHVHERLTETFLVLEGEVEIWLDRDVKHTLGMLELLQAEPGVEHLVRNQSTAPARLLFVKTPDIDDDKVDRPWTPSAS